MNPGEIFKKSINWDCIVYEDQTYLKSDNLSCDLLYMILGFLAHAKILVSIILANASY